MTPTATVTWKHRQKPLLTPALLLTGGLLAAFAQAQEAPVQDENTPPGLVEQAGPSAATLDDLRTFSDTFNVIRQHYVDELPEQQLLDAALRGMVSSLDPHSRFLSPDALRQRDDTARGREVGIGAALAIDDERRLIIERVYPDGPAWLAGVRDGDIVLAVDGERVRGRRIQRSINAVAGEAGTAVVLRLRSGELPPREVTLERAEVPVPSVRSRLVDGGVGILEIARFQLNTAEEFERHLSELAQQSSNGLNGIIVDLRDNPGGSVKPAAVVADGFLDEGLVVYTRGRYPASHFEYQALPGQWAPGVPLAVLVNGGSASASEILAGALQDHDRATIVGSRTYGKGTVQSVLHMRNGSGLRLTTARYYTPAGRSFDGAGIQPDVEISGDGAEVDDPVLTAALEVLDARGD